MPTQSLLVTYDQLSTAKDFHGLHPDSFNNVIAQYNNQDHVVTEMLLLDMASVFVEKL